jgi:hypothetical protein
MQGIPPHSDPTSAQAASASQATLRLEWAIVRAVAVEADADPRTVQKCLRGEKVRGMVERRVKAVLARRGIASLDRPSAHEQEIAR